MTQKLQPVRGTHDILPQEARKRDWLNDVFARVTDCYGYGEVIPPMFEFSDVFHRTLGDTSDVVTKETYTFTDRGGESLTLRPEFTASVVRAFISNGLTQELPFKARYYGPAFRYERPQKGRQRQFYQFGAELLGVAEPLGDVELIAMAAQLLKAWGLEGAATLELNSLGDVESRAAYRSQLVSYFSDHRANLSEDSKIRLEKNPLRILDSKDEGDRNIIAGAPKLSDSFNDISRSFFEQVKAGLAALSIPYTLNPKIVRGLDYYSHTVFEFTTDKLGAQGTVLAGGRYDGLVAMMGGPEIPGVGFGCGVERLLMLRETLALTEGAEKPRPVAVIPVDDAQEKDALLLTQELHLQLIPAELITRGNMGKRMKKAEKIGARAVCILGENEVKNHCVTVKDMQNGTQAEVARAVIKEYLKNL